MYSGVFVRPVTWTPVGPGAGLDQADTKGRLGTYYRSYHRNFSSQGVQENSGDIPWRMYTTDTRLTDEVSAGLHSQTFLGTGGRLRYRFARKFRWIPAIQSVITRNKEGRWSFLLGMHTVFPLEK